MPKVAYPVSKLGKSDQQPTTKYVPRCEAEELMYLLSVDPRFDYIGERVPCERSQKEGIS
ncbi:hypothetical protein DBT_0525 [Dissulfuribacter thermophilus]|uniref:Uncharacterized protein n=1 Tax=Dissulfuribacter thermophilus TaxID=1156395 RepID=A0A1B9F859_9BACT|nr:hypothetical protein DBT_0525 [Dissulfuribacter thermophilus]